MRKRDGKPPERSLTLAPAMSGQARVTVAGIHQVHDGDAVSLTLNVQPIASAGKALLLVCLVENPHAGQTQLAGRHTQKAGDFGLTPVGLGLEGIVHTIEVSSAEYEAVRERAFFVNDELEQASNAAFSSNRISADNAGQDAPTSHRISAKDLHTILACTDTALLVLDPDLNIRFFTPAARELFNFRPGDAGRPLSDLRSLATDIALEADARAVLQGGPPVLRDIAAGDAWLSRRVLRCQTPDGVVQGVIITFSDITERRRAASAGDEARRQSDENNAADWRFLASASYALRQPLQTLVLIQNLMARAPGPEQLGHLTTQMGESLGKLSALLNTVLDLNRIEAGIVSAERARFTANDVLSRLREEFSAPVAAKGLSLQVMPCGIFIESDPRLLEQLLRNLLLNALQYTSAGRILVGCRRRSGPGDKPMLAIEVWDTGIGIPEDDFGALFDERRQRRHPARDGRLGLGLPVVKRLGDLLGHPIRVASWVGRGSVFSVDIALPAIGPSVAPQGSIAARHQAVSPVRTGEILVVEKDPDLRGLLAICLRQNGHRPTVVGSAAEALELIARKSVRPDVVLADYNIGGELNGVQLAAALRIRAGRDIPVVILTGDTSASVMRAIASQDCTQLHKPVQPAILFEAIGELLPSLAPSDRTGVGRLRVAIIDADTQLRQALRTILEDDGFSVADYASCEAFVAAHPPGDVQHDVGCLLVDAAVLGVSGIEPLSWLRGAGDQTPAILIAAQGSAQLAVEAMKAGAADYLQKPIERSELLAAVGNALEADRNRSESFSRYSAAALSIAGLTERQRQVMRMVIAGHPSKNIAADLGISRRTVENHRAAIMSRTGASSIPALTKLSLMATWAEAGTSQPPITSSDAGKVCSEPPD